MWVPQAKAYGIVEWFILVFAFVSRLKVIRVWSRKPATTLTPSGDEEMLQTNDS